MLKKEIKSDKNWNFFFEISEKDLEDFNLKDFEKLFIKIFYENSEEFQVMEIFLNKNKKEKKSFISKEKFEKNMKKNWENFEILDEDLENLNFHILWNKWFLKIISPISWTIYNNNEKLFFTGNTKENSKILIKADWKVLGTTFSDENWKFYFKSPQGINNFSNLSKIFIKNLDSLEEKEFFIWVWNDEKFLWNFDFLKKIKF
jgi:hypothetical protein